MPKLSILLPTFNRAGYLKECIDSLLTTTVDCEIVINDNASADNTPEVVASYKDPRIRYFRQKENTGGLTYDFMIKNSTGELITIFGDDDRALPGCFEGKLALFEQVPDLDLAYSLWYQIDSQGRNQGVVRWPGLLGHSYVGGRDEFGDLLVASYIMWQAVVMRRSIYEAIGGINIKLIGSDYDFLLRYLRGRKTAFLHEPTVEIRVHGTTNTNKFAVNGTFERERLALWRRYLLEDADPPVINHLRWQWMEQSFRNDAIAHVGSEAATLQPLFKEFDEIRSAYFARMEERAWTLAGGKSSARAPAVAPSLPQVVIPAKTVWVSPIYDPSGYADEARSFILELERGGLPLAARRIGRHSDQFRARMDESTRARLDAALDRPIETGCTAVIHFPGSAFQRIEGAGYIVGRTMYETDRVPAAWVTRCNQLDEIWVPCEHNVESFRRAGVTVPIFRIPEGIDTAKFRPGHSPLPLPGAKGTIFLAIFEWIFRKGWDVLLRAWARAFQPGDDVTLVIRSYPVNEIDGDKKTEIERRINAFLQSELGLARAAVAPIIVLGEPIPDADMPRLYAAAHAYLTPSRGEGWGRPHMEAMATGLPVVATRWSGNLDFMNDENSLLIDVAGLVEVDGRAETTEPGHRWAEPSVDSLVRHLRRVVEDPAGVAQIGARARRDMETKWRWEQIAALARKRLDEIEVERKNGTAQARRSQPAKPAPIAPPPVAAPPVAAPPAPIAPPRPAAPAPRANPDAIPVRWEGSQFVYHSLAHVNREFCRELIASGRADLEIIPYERDQFQAGPGSPFAPIAARVNRPLGRPAAVHVRHQWPPRFEAPPEGAWVMIQPWEYGALPANWVAPMRDAVDELWVPSTWLRDMYIRSGIPGEKVFVVPNGVDTSFYRPQGPKYPLQTGKRFKLLFVGGLIHRKGIDVLLNAYLSTFTAADDVCLVIKGFGAESVYANNSVHAQLMEIVKAGAQNPKLPAIEYIPDTLTDEQIAALYRASDALVCPYRGEGFGMPITEAMATGLPVIVTGYGACLDFCDETNAYLIPATQKPIQASDIKPHPAGHFVAEPDPTVLAQLLRRVVTNPAEARARGQRGRERIQSQFQWQHGAARALERIKVLARRKPIRFAPPPAWFRADVEPLPLDPPRGTTFLLHPDWTKSHWKQVVAAYAAAFPAGTDVALWIWLDPNQGMTAIKFQEETVALLAQANIDPNGFADVFVISWDLPMEDIGRLYAAVDGVTAVADDVAAARARAAGKPALRTASPSAFRAAFEAASPTRKGEENG